jgi:carbonyl reductase 1
LKRPGGRIVNVGSAAGSNYVQPLPDSNSVKDKLTKPWLIMGGIAEVDDMARSFGSTIPPKEAYGASKALLHSYTAIHAKLETDLLINAVTPGFIQTDLTAGFGATKPPSNGAVPPCWLMMDTEFVPHQPQGRYYGSDCVRSPLHFYRGPGEDPYINDDDIVELPQSAKEAVASKV